MSVYEVACYFVKEAGTQQMKLFCKEGKCGPVVPVTGFRCACFGYITRSKMSLQAEITIFNIWKTCFRRKTKCNLMVLSSLRGVRIWVRIFRKAVSGPRSHGYTHANTTLTGGFASLLILLTTKKRFSSENIMQYDFSYNELLKQESNRISRSQSVCVKHRHRLLLHSQSGERRGRVVADSLSWLSCYSSSG